jgi:hypothetical protein
MAHLRLRDCWPAPRLAGNADISPPASVAGWELVPAATRFHERTESFAKYCRRWVYRRGAMTAEVSLAYPFTTGYHDPAVCYRSAGWAVMGRVAHDPGAADLATGNVGGSGGPVGAADDRVADAPYFELDLTKMASTRGHLLYAAFDERGRWEAPRPQQPPANPILYRLWLSRRVAGLVPTHEVQTLVVSVEPLQAEQRRAAEALFLTVREDLSRQALALLPGAREGQPDD